MKLSVDSGSPLWASTAFLPKAAGLRIAGLRNGLRKVLDRGGSQKTVESGGIGQLYLVSTITERDAAALQGGLLSSTDRVLPPYCIRALPAMCARPQESAHIEQITETQWKLKEGFVDNMRVPGYFYVNEHLRSLVFEELETFCARGDVGGFLPAVKQIANVAALPGIVQARGRLECSAVSSTTRHLIQQLFCGTVQKSIALPDMHSGYGFAIGNVAAFDMDDPAAVVSPGGVGFDINCGVRLVRTNLVTAPVSGCADASHQAAPSLAVS